MDRNSDISTIRDFENCCRLCFERGSQLENVFASSSEPNLTGKIADCLGVSISTEDFPATSICVRCLTLVHQFYDFKQLCKMHDQTFQTSIRSECSVELIPQRPTEVFIKSEVLDDFEESIQLAPLEIDSESLVQEMAPADETAGTSLVVPVNDKRSKKKKPVQLTQEISVRLVYNGYLMKCNGIKLNGGIMQWVCRNSRCRLSFSSTVDWQITLNMNKIHSHYPYVEKKGMIQCVNSGFEERYAVSTITGKTVLIWDGQDWLITDKNKSDKRRASCKEHGCRKYLTVTEDFSRLEHFGEHNHLKNFIIFRDEENPAENDLTNPWDLFIQINPCKLPIGMDWDLNRRMKLFHNSYQYRLADCSWNGLSRWACDTINCQVMATMDGLGQVHSADHNHEPLAAGLFNRLYYCVVKANMKCLKLFFNGHCYGSRDSDHWVCTVTACYAKVFVGSNYDAFAEKGTHTHEAYSAVIKPMKKDAIHLTPQSPYLPPSITIDDLHESKPSTSIAVSTDSTPAKVAPEKTPKKTTKKPTQTDERESNTRGVRMFFDGFRYTLWEIFPDGTTYWRCWGMRCNKSVHMTPTGSIYFKNDSLEHQHGPHVSKVDQITHENGQMERYAIFIDNTSNTILAYRNTLWHLVLGEASFIAACREVGCEAKIKITGNFAHFEHIGECANHGDKLLLIRTAAEPVEGDPNIWELFKKKYPLRSVDGTIHDGGRHSQMFIGGYRYTMQGLNWNGSSLWRCALQKCPARCRIIESVGTFPAPSHNHNHEKQELLQGRIWSHVRQREERYFVIITLKKTTATMYYNTYCYSLKDKQRNVWTCFHTLCNASLRIEGDFEWVVDEMMHTHPGTLTFVRDNESAASQECYAPTPGISRKRSREAADDYLVDVKPFILPCSTTASSSKSNGSPKLEAILNTLVVLPKIDQTSQEQNAYHYHGGYTYNRKTLQADGNTKLECSKLRCPGQVVLSPDRTVLSQDNHIHSKTFDNVGSIRNASDQDQEYLYILVSGMQKRTVTYFVCDGFRYHVQTKAPDVEAAVIWQCVKCEAIATVNDSYSYIALTSPHNHESSDIIIPSDENAESNLEANNTFDLDEVIWGQHRYINPIYIRRMKQTKWKCYRLKDCKAYVYRNQEGRFKQMEQHNHEDPIELCGEAGFDQNLKLKDRFAIMKHYGKSKFRHMAFQNQIYVESSSYYWNCIRYSCNAKLSVDASRYHFELVGEHCHQPIMTVIKFQDEVVN